jgi:uncharacterized membrane protein
MLGDMHGRMNVEMMSATAALKCRKGVPRMARLDTPGSLQPMPSVLSVANVVYALHTLAIIIGIAGAATVIGSFVGSVPSLLAVLLNYIKRGDARGTWADSHYRWQIRTFWYALLWAIVGWVMIFTVIGVVVGAPILIALTLWLIYRIGRGWLRLRDGRPMYAA